MHLFVASCVSQRIGDSEGKAVNRILAVLSMKHILFSTSLPHPCPLPLGEGELSIGALIWRMIQWFKGGKARSSFWDFLQSFQLAALQTVKIAARRSGTASRSPGSSYQRIRKEKKRDCP
jgi:hypothetical protein